MPDVQAYDRVVNELRESYIAKNTDYGDSFSKMFAKFGLLSTVIRLTDKVGRLETLCEREPMVKEESVRDTLKDIANYCIMTVMELDREVVSSGGTDAETKGVCAGVPEGQEC